MPDISLLLLLFLTAMFVVSYGSAENRLVYFENEDEWWKGGCSVYTVPKPSVFPKADNDKQKYVLMI